MAKKSDQKGHRRVINTQNAKYEDYDFDLDSISDDIPQGRFRLVTKLKRKIFNRRRKKNSDNDNDDSPSSLSSSSNKEKRGNVDIVPLGFLTNIPEYMVAADILVSKAGPGTIAEAAAVGLPVMMTRYVICLLYCVISVM